jgi:hypothetical protein
MAEYARVDGLIGGIVGQQFADAVRGDPHDPLLLQPGRFAGAGQADQHYDALSRAGQSGPISHEAGSSALV